MIIKIKLRLHFHNMVENAIIKGLNKKKRLKKFLNKHEKKKP